MAVEVNSTRKAVEISWDDLGGENGGIEEPPDSEKPGDFPSHPIAPGGGPHPEHPIAPGGEAPDQGLPGEQPRPDHELPPEGVGPDQGLPEEPRPEHPIAPGGERPDQGLPPSGVGPSHPIYLPPYIDNTLPGEVRDKVREFLTGNLPPHTEPHGGKQIAVQIFAQGQDGDWSNTPVMPNDGLAVLTYPEDFTGESYVEVRSLDGALVDYGTITVE